MPNRKRQIVGEEVLAEAVKEFGLYLKALRRAKGLTQVELQLALGLETAVTVSRWEIGDRAPGDVNLRKLATALGVDEEELLNKARSMLLTDGDIDVADPDLSLFFRGEWHGFTDDEKAFIKSALIERAEFVAKQKRETQQHGTELDEE